MRTSGPSVATIPVLYQIREGTAWHLTRLSVVLWRELHATGQINGVRFAAVRVVDSCLVRDFVLDSKFPKPCYRLVGHGLIRSA